MARWLLIGRPLRFVLSRCPFGVRLAYARTVARLRQLPVIGPVLEKMQIVIRGDVPDGYRFEQRQFESAVGMADTPNSTSSRQGNLATSVAA